MSMDGVVTQIATMTPIVDEAYERRLKRRREIASHDPRKRCGLERGWRVPPPVAHT